MKLCAKHGIAYEDYGWKSGINQTLDCPVCEAEQEIRRHEILQEELRAGKTELLAALVRMVGNCERYLEERPTSESDDYNPDYVSPLKQARAAIAKAEGGQS